MGTDFADRGGFQGPGVLDSELGIPSLNLFHVGFPPLGYFLASFRTFHLAMLDLVH